MRSVEGLRSFRKVCSSNERNIVDIHRHQPSSLILNQKRALTHAETASRKLSPTLEMMQCSRRELAFVRKVILFAVQQATKQNYCTLECHSSTKNFSNKKLGILSKRLWLKYSELLLSQYNLQTSAFTSGSTDGFSGLRKCCRISRVRSGPAEVRLEQRCGVGERVKQELKQRRERVQTLRVHTKDAHCPRGPQEHESRQTKRQRLSRSFRVRCELYDTFALVSKGDRDDHFVQSVKRRTVAHVMVSSADATYFYET